jgi:CRP/FNR family transcriptional regulator, cyclic AMP receptor protein
MSPAPKIDLGTIWLFKGCSKAELKAIEKATVEKDVAAGEVIVDEGTVGMAAYVIVEGKAAVLRRNRKFAELQPGEMFGEISLLDRLPRSATVKALTDMRLLELTQKQFDAVLKESPSTTRKLLTEMAVRLRDADQRMVH